MFVNYKFLTSKIITRELLPTVLVAFFLNFAVYAEEDKAIPLIADENINKYLDKVSEIEMTLGPHNEAIVENLVSLSRIYKDQSDGIC